MGPNFLSRYCASLTYQDKVMKNPYPLREVRPINFKNLTLKALVIGQNHCSVVRLM